MLIIRDLGRHVELGIVDGGLVQRGGTHAVPRHVARQAQRAGRAQHGAAAGPPAPAIRTRIFLKFLQKEIENFLFRENNYFSSLAKYHSTVILEKHLATAHNMKFIKIYRMLLKVPSHQFRSVWLGKWAGLDD